MRPRRRRGRRRVKIFVRPATASLRQPARHQYRHHRAEATAHLARSDRMALVAQRGQRRSRPYAVSLEELCDGRGARRLRAYSQRQCCEAAQHEVSSRRRGHSPCSLASPQPVAQRSDPVYDQRASEHVAVTPRYFVVLCMTMSAPSQRSLQDGTGKYRRRRAARHARAPRCRKRRDVAHAQQRVRRCLFESIEVGALGCARDCCDAVVSTNSAPARPFRQDVPQLFRRVVAVLEAHDAPAVASRSETLQASWLSLSRRRSASTRRSSSWRRSRAKRAAIGVAGRRVQLCPCG